MNRLYLVRHGESESNHFNNNLQPNALVRWKGARQPDIPLTERGRRQAIATGKYLARFQFHRVFVSPYLRAIQTQELITGEFAGFDPKAQLRYDERIRERESGMLEGLTPEGVRFKYPDEAQRRDKEGGYYYRAPGGESYPDVSLRVHSFLNSMRQNFAGKDLLVVCHGVVMWSFRRMLERMGESDLLSMQTLPEQNMCNCVVLEYGAGASGKMELLSNRVCYGPEDAASDACRSRAASGS